MTPGENFPRCFPSCFILSVHLDGIQVTTNGSHKETAFCRHPSARGERARLHSHGGTPAIFKAQLVFSEV